jgi:hypothetical protein
MDGALMEVGPYRLQDDHTLKYNEGRWDESTIQPNDSALPVRDVTILEMPEEQVAVGVGIDLDAYRLQDDHTLKYNEGRWDEFANLLFVDNPVGTGYHPWSYILGHHSAK